MEKGRRMGSCRDGKVKIQFPALQFDYFVGNYVCYLFLTNSNVSNGHQKPTTGTLIFERFAHQQSQANGIEAFISSQSAQQRFPRYDVLDIIGVAGWAAPPPQNSNVLFENNRLLTVDYFIG